MNVKIEYTVDATDKVRLAIARLRGLPGLASRDDVKWFFKSRGVDIGYELIADEIGRINREAEALAATIRGTS